MKISTVIVAFGLFAPLMGTPVAQNQPQATNRILERVGDTGFLALQADSFPRLDAQHKALAYWLTQASIAIDPIIYDQLSRYGLRQKRLLEGVVAHHASVPAPVFARIREYALLFWANRGNHNEISAQKIMPRFTFEELQDAALKAQAAGAFKTGSADLPPLQSADAVKTELADLKASIFDPAFE